MYVESSLPGMGPYDNAVFFSEHLVPSQQYCLSFWYHMYGSGKMNILSVKHKSGSLGYFIESTI
jgi:hypothetical protein